MTVQALLVKHHRNAEAAVLEEEFLDVIREHGHAAGVFTAAGIARPSTLTQPATVAKGLLGLLEVEVALRIEHFFGLR